MITMVVFQCVFMGIDQFGAEWMSRENGPIESAQAILALIGALGLFYAAATAKVGQAALTVCGAAIAYAAARESDDLFESLLFDDAYKYLVGLPMFVLCVVVLVRKRDGIIRETLWVMQQPSATLFAIAGIYLCFVCQSYDRPGMWHAIADETQLAITKTMVEEYAELFAYLLIALCGFEANLFARQTRVEAKILPLETLQSRSGQASEFVADSQQQVA